MPDAENEVNLEANVISNFPMKESGWKSSLPSYELRGYYCCSTKQGGIDFFGKRRSNGWYRIYEEGIFLPESFIANEKGKATLMLGEPGAAVRVDGMEIKLAKKGSG